MILRLMALTLFLIGLLAGCGKHYWEANKRGVADFQSDSGLCIQEAKTKYGVSETIYRGCMRTHGWRRVQTQYPTDLQFRGPEDEDDFLSPPDPLSARGPAQPPGPQSMLGSRQWHRPMLASHRPMFRVIPMSCRIPRRIARLEALGAAAG
jgi:hypothetical protein